MKNRKAELGQRIPVTLGNIAPLSLTPFRPGRMALVCEGGGSGVSLPQACWMSLCVRSLILSISTSAHQPVRKISRRISATSPATGVKSLCAIPPGANFLIRCDLYAEETLLTSTGWWNPPPPGCRCKWIPQRACSTAENPFICAPAGGMITRRAIFRRQNKTGLISFAPPAPYRVSTVPALR